MTSARNRPPLLSGNRRLLFVCVALLATACTPKIQPVATAPVKTIQPEAKKEPEKVQAKPVENKVNSIAMLLPFDLDNLNPGYQYNSSSLTSANLSLDY